MLNHILKLLEEHNIFLTGGGGVGKSYTTKEILRIYKSNNKNVVALGSTGISAVALGGVSIHSFFKFGLCADFLELKALDAKQKGKLKELFDIIKNIDLLIIDEISMVSADLMEMISLRLMQGGFKGRLMVVGDFYQLPPVKRQKDDMALIKFNYAFDSTAWYNFKFKNIELVISKRTSDVQFYSMLSRIRLGIIDAEIYKKLSSKITNEIAKDSVILYGRNAEADALNAKKLAQIPNPLETISASGRVYDETLQNDAYTKWINNLNVLSELKIKIGARVMFLSNKWGEYYNGEQGIIKNINKDDNDAIVSISVLKDSGNIADVEPFTYSLFEYEKDDEGGIKEKLRAEFTQFPLKLAYAITIHKSQGMSIRHLVCDLNNIFANGQLYVALSRAISWNDLSIIYTRKRDFYSYLKSVVNIDKCVARFYEKENFIKERI
ncbi:AAA family ATPase [uncultured Campylobacter sp.]|uniref:ATP-dependent DNA helicase n=1 Tax=uncultured Campylobacter sp. TaxID=218934 RepID=UPI0026297633|nr:AAA family ATPase [uncultured Campylobacter sp.]